MWQHHMTLLVMHSSVAFEVAQQWIGIEGVEGTEAEPEISWQWILDHIDDLLALAPQICQLVDDACHSRTNRVK